MADSELRPLLLRSDLVVLGTIRLGACRDGCVGSVLVQEVLVGESSERTISFMTRAPRSGMRNPAAPLILFLTRELRSPAQWLLLLVNQEFGVSPNQAKKITDTRLARAAVDAERAPFAADLEALRGHDQARRHGDAIVDPARRVFQNLDFRGLAADRLSQLLGAPARTQKQGDYSLWSYSFHDGEQGVMPQVWLHENRVVQVEVIYGQ